MGAPGNFINRPGVAGADLQTPPRLSQSSFNLNIFQLEFSRSHAVSDGKYADMKKVCVGLFYQMFSWVFHFSCPLEQQHQLSSDRKLTCLGTVSNRYKNYNQHT